MTASNVPTVNTNFFMFEKSVRSWKNDLSKLLIMNNSGKHSKSIDWKSKKVIFPTKNLSNGKKGEK